jgi:hypothetical protein
LANIWQLLGKKKSRVPTPTKRCQLRSKGKVKTKMNKLYFKKIIDDNRFKKFPEFDNYKNLRILKQA